jgi:hypothetical protein
MFPPDTMEYFKNHWDEEVVIGAELVLGDF